MPQYQSFSADDAIQYANQHSEFFGERSQLSSENFGESHMNQVFRVKNQFNHGLIVKQALPFARGLSERWPLTLDRSRLEAQALQLFAKAAPDRVVEVLHYDSEQAVMLLEDLDHYSLLSTALAAGKQFQLLGTQIGSFVAQCSFANSDFALDLPAKKARQIQFSNPEPLQISEDLLFTDPFCNHERNQVDASLRPLAQHLWLDEQLQAKVTALAAGFRSKAQTLLHGDLNSSSIFIQTDHCKVIDAEFAGFGPVGLDAGLFVGSLLFYYCAAPALIADPNKARDHQDYLHNQIKQFWQHFHQQFLQLCATECRDALFGNTLYQQEFLSDVLKDLTGYAGCELIRQIIGTFPAAELRSIKLVTARLQLCQHALLLGQRLILQHQQVTSIDQLLSWLKDSRS